MGNKELKTTDSQRKAVREYEKRNYRLNIVFLMGQRKGLRRLILIKLIPPLSVTQY